MHAAGWAFAFAIWTRHRLGLSLVLGYLLIVVLLANAVPGELSTRSIVAPLTFPLWFAVPYLWVIFCLEERPELLYRRSGYPRRFFAMPLTSLSLAACPFAISAATLILFWLAVNGLILRPVGFSIPLLWPAVFLVAVQVWLQALAWWHFPVPFLKELLRATAATLIFVGLVGFTSYFMYFWRPGPKDPLRELMDEISNTIQAPPIFFLAATTASIPLSFFIASLGVARARCANIPTWHLPAFLSRNATPARLRHPFASAARAMFWFQWQRTGLFLPLMLLPATGFILFPLGLSVRHEAVNNLVAVTALTLAYATVMAHAAGALLGSDRSWSRKVVGMQPFLAVRPASTASLIGVKLKVAAVSVLFAWLLIYGAILVTFFPVLSLLAFPVANNSFLDPTDTKVLEDHKLQAWIMMGLILVGLPAITWKEFISQLWVGMRGRGHSLSGLGLHLAPMLGFVVVIVLSATAPSLLAILVGLKVVGGCMIARELQRRGLVRHRTVMYLGLAWITAAAAIVGLAMSLTPNGWHWTFAAAGILLLLPTVRLGLAPLMMDDYRHP